MKSIIQKKKKIKQKQIKKITNQQFKQNAVDLVTKTTLLDITLQPNSSIEIPAMEMAFVYLIKGEIIIADKEIASTSLINFESEGENVIVRTGDKTANFIFASGTPHNEPIVHGGPFVMTTKEQMLETQDRLQRGEMGILNPL